MQAIGNCPYCKLENAPIEILQIGQDNEFHGRCVACGAQSRGVLILRTEPESKEHKALGASSGQIS